jgi:putative NAD(P)-binding protein
MRVTVLGGTGKAGGAVLREALARGHEVRALVRTPSKLDLRHPALEVVPGGFEDTGALHSALEGADVVITAIGVTSRMRPTLLEDSVNAIRAEMQQSGVGHLIVVQGVHLPFPGDPRNVGLLVLKAILRVVMLPVVLDGHRLVTRLQSDRSDWTVIRMPVLKVAPPTGNLKVGALRVSPLSHVTSGDVAVFALTCAERGDYLREMPMVASGQPQRQGGSSDHDGKDTSRFEGATSET